MKHINKISLGLVVLGILLISYPFALRVQTHMEERKIRSQFAEAGFQEHITEALPVQVEANLDDVPEKPVPITFTQWPNSILRIKAISLEVPVVEVQDLSVFKQDINQLPAHYPESGLPGEPGNIAIAGHVGGPAGYFGKLYKIKPKDIIELDTPQKLFKYEVERVFITEKDDWGVVAKTDTEILTLTTCSRVGTNTSAKRQIVQAKRIE